MGDSETLSPVLKYSHPEDLHDTSDALVKHLHSPVGSPDYKPYSQYLTPHSPVSQLFHVDWHNPSATLALQSVILYSLNLFSCLSTIPYQHNFFNMFLCLFIFIIFVYIYCVSFTFFICPSHTKKVT